VLGGGVPRLWQEKETFSMFQKEGLASWPVVMKRHLGGMCEFQGEIPVGFFTAKKIWAVGWRGVRGYWPHSVRC